MKAIIGRYYKKFAAAEKYAEKMRKKWRGKIAWYVIQYRGGHLVVSESVARAAFPDIKFPYTDRAYRLTRNEEK